MPFFHIDLFSGIGGFSLATEMVWKDVRHVFCDNEPFSQAIIRKHWPESPIYGDIRGLGLTTYTNDNRLHGRNSKINTAKGGKQTLHDATRRAARLAPKIDLITGGFPCQPFSNAGKRKGTDDDRHLWPEMFRVIHEFQPRWVIAENVRGLTNWNGGMVLGQVRSDLEDDGYEVQSFIIPACSVNAPHRRDRIWIVAHRNGGGLRKQPKPEQGRESSLLTFPDHVAHTEGDDADGRSKEVSGSNEQEPAPRQNKRPTESGRTNKYDGSDSKNIRLQRERNEAHTSGKKSNDKFSDGRSRGRIDSDSDTGRIKRHERTSVKERAVARSGTSWERDWTEVAAELCTVDDGLPNGLARPRSWRNAALKGAGNAIVPQVAAQIMMAIKRTDELYGR